MTAWAAALCASRVALGRHFIGDVLAVCTPSFIFSHAGVPEYTSRSHSNVEIAVNKNANKIVWPSFVNG